MPTPDRISYTVKDAAKATGLSVSTLYNLRRDGKLVMVKVCGRTLVPADALKRLLVASYQEGVAA